MAVARTTSFTNLVTPGLRSVYFQTLKEIPKEFRQWANVLGANPGGSAGRNFFDDYKISSLGTMALKPEGNPVSYDIPVDGTTVRYTPFSYGLGFRVTEEMQEDDLYSTMVKMSKELAGSAAHQMEVQAHRVLNTGFSATGGTGLTAAGFDTLALFSTAHTLLRGGTDANRASTDMDLSLTALENAIIDLEEIVNDSNMPTPKKGELIICGPQLKFIAKELTESELKPYTGNNEVNPLGGEGLRYQISHYLTDPDSWFILPAKAQHDLNVWVRREPRFQGGDDFDTGDSKFKGTFRIACGHGDWRGTYGSQGA